MQISNGEPSRREIRFQKSTRPGQTSTGCTVSLHEEGPHRWPPSSGECLLPVPLPKHAVCRTRCETFGKKFICVPVGDIYRINSASHRKRESERSKSSPLICKQYQSPQRKIVAGASPHSKGEETTARVSEPRERAFDLGSAGGERASPSSTRKLNPFAIPEISIVAVPQH